VPGLVNKKEIIKRARELRSNMPPAELKLWAELRSKQLDGLRFRRQHTIPPFIVDFYLPSHRLVIEVDGDSHDDNTAYEIRRTYYLEQREYKILRFRNEEVYEDLAGVIERIREYCGNHKETPTLPPPEKSQGGEDNSSPLRGEVRWGAYPLPKKTAFRNLSIGRPGEKRIHKPIDKEINEENMEKKQVIEIIRSLAEGVDPFTGEVFDEDSPYNRPDTIRALYKTLDVLNSLTDSIVERNKKKGLPARSGEKWTDEEDKQLIEGYDLKKSVRDLAVEHQRTKGAITSRLIKKGKMII